MKSLGLLCVAVASLSASIDGAEDAGGDVAGAVSYRPDPQRPWRYARYYVADAKKGLLAEAVVCLTDRKLRGLRPPSESRTVTMGQEDYRFIPETIAVRAGDRVRFTNSDATLHNVMTLGSDERLNVSLSQDSEFVYSFSRAGNLRQPIKIGCSFHSQMQAWIFVFDHPFYTVTSADGHYRFEGVPPGEYKLELWHPAGGLRQTRTVTVTTGETQTVDLRTSPADIVK